MSQYTQQYGRTVPGGELMIPTYSARSSNSNNSKNSDNSNMSTDDYSIYSPNTSLNDNDLSYQNDYPYSRGQESQYAVAFSDYNTNHLAYSNPTGYPYNQWSPSRQDSTVQQSPVISYKGENTTTSYQQSSSDNTRHTIDSLGWNRDLRYLREENGCYRFVVNKGKDPYYQLLSPENASPSTPLQVFLTQPLTTSQKYYTCAHPFPTTYLKKKCTCPTKFKRPADLERHYRHVHEVQSTSEEALSPAGSASPLPCTGNDDAKVDEIYRCDRGGCTRAAKPLRRKDHFRDHLREFHKEDVGQEKMKRDDTKEMWEAKQKAWELARVIIPGRWRCIKCLKNNKVSRSGWICGGAGCTAVCDEKRRIARENMVKGEMRDQMDRDTSGPIVCNIDGRIGCQEICEAKAKHARQQAEEEARRRESAMSMLVPDPCNTCTGSGMYSWGNCPDCSSANEPAMGYHASLFDSEMHSYDVDAYMT